jgi:hypothetical protein
VKSIDDPLLSADASYSKQPGVPIINSIYVGGWMDGSHATIYNHLEERPDPSRPGISYAPRLVYLILLCCHLGPERSSIWRRGSGSWPLILIHCTWCRLPGINELKVVKVF